MNKIRKGDQVVVITGKNKGARGSVLNILDKKVLVQGVNIIKKHQKPNPMRGVNGGIVAQEAPVDVSNVMLFNPKTQKGDRVGFRVLEDGRKVRFFKSTNEQVEA
jgi:large subunit ribosomal protein L24